MLVFLLFGMLDRNFINCSCDDFYCIFLKNKTCYSFFEFITSFSIVSVDYDNYDCLLVVSGMERWFLRSVN